jgi:phosphoglycerate dehydrogenase-like enzyme
MSNDHLIAVPVHGSLRDEIFCAAAWKKLKSFGTVVVHEHETQPASSDEARDIIAGAEVVVTSWGSPRVDANLLEAAPGLKLHCHGAGTVKPYVSDDEFERGVVVTSSAAAIAVGVAETTMAWMVIAAKQALAGNIAAHAGGWKQEMPHPPRDFRHKTIGIIGASHVGRRVIELLERFENNVILYDPYVSEADASSLGVRKVELTELMRTSDIVSLHAPDTTETNGMINREMLELMQDGASFINTARGALVDEDALADVLETGRIWAFLDVTEPEPPATDHRFRRLPNCVITPHIAGCVEAGRLLIGDYVVEEVRRYLIDEPPAYPINRARFDRIG